jgi:hypothetical protein
MKSCKHILIAALFGIVFFGQLPAASSQSLYFDPINGDNRNPGTSSTTALKGSAQTVSDKNDGFTQPREAEQWGTVPFDGAKSPEIPAGAAEEMTRIILGSETVTGWKAFATSIWQAPFELDQNWSLEGFSIDGSWLEMGCNSDFLDNQQYSWELDALYINDPDGNPTDMGKTVTAHLYDYWEDQASSLDVTGWALSPPSVWQVEFPKEPVHLFIDDVIFNENWWYGPLHCEQDTGQAGYLYLRDAQGNPDTEGKTVAVMTDSGGWAVTAGDFNGDGFQDVVHSNGGTRIYINYGAPRFSAVPGQILSSPDEGMIFGFNVASAGDVNHDGFDDLIVSMDWSAKTVYLYLGSVSGLNQTPDRVIAPPANVSAYGFGHGIAGNGDINGDGYSDILIMGGDDTSSYLCVYLGNADGIGPEPDSVIYYDGKIYGGSVCIVGDMNHDGRDEVAVSLNDPPPVTHIDVLIYRSSRNGRLFHPRRLRIAIPENSSAVHGEVAAAGDVNRDGFADLVVGNQWAEGDFANEGKAYLVFGPACRFLVKPDIIIDNPIPEFNARFGSIVSGIGDFDHNGYADIGVGCPYSQDGQGFVAVYSGSACRISNNPAHIITGMGSFGWSLSEAGDLKGIGQPYLIAGEESGGSYLYALPPWDPPFWQHDHNGGLSFPGQFHRPPCGRRFP